MRTYFRRPQTPADVSVGRWLLDLKAQATAALDRKVVFDMAGIEKINSRELAEVVGVHLSLTREERRLVLANAETPVAEVFEMTRMNRLIQISGKRETVRGDAAGLVTSAY